MPALPPPPPAPTNDIGRAREQERIAVVVELIVRSKSFDRGFEAALIFLPDAREGVSAALIDEANRTRDARVSERCLEALGAMARLRLVPEGQRARAVETVTAKVRTENAPLTWAAAVVALGSLSGVDAGRDVTDALSRAVDEDVPGVVKACAEVLAELSYRPAVGALVTAADRAKDRAATRAIVRALGRVGGPEATERLKRALGEPDPEDREAAANALGESGGKAAAAALKQTILRKEETPGVRRAAIAALERMGDDEAVKALQACRAEFVERKSDALAHEISDALDRLKK